ncbi:MAG: LytTR family transcriptional regulator [Bacteroidales bacterium]|nr:LytTR family transcriptional regulator [Bacteroidales bacterium]
MNCRTDCPSRARICNLCYQYCSTNPYPSAPLIPSRSPSNHQHYQYSKTLEQILHDLNPKDFIRANKQYILSRDSIAEMLIRYDNRLQVQLHIETPEKIFVSKNKSAEFKSWFTQHI